MSARLLPRFRRGARSRILDLQERDSSSFQRQARVSRGGPPHFLKEAVRRDPMKSFSQPGLGLTPPVAVTMPERGLIGG